MASRWGPRSWRCRCLRRCGIAQQRRGWLAWLGWRAWTLMGSGECGGLGWPANGGHDVDFSVAGCPARRVRCGLRWGGRGVLVVGLGVVVVAGGVGGVGEADVDGVVQVEVLAVPGRDDGAGGDIRVVAVSDGALWFGQGRARREQGPVGPVERERPAAAAGAEGAAGGDSTE